MSTLNFLNSKSSKYLSLKLQKKLKIFGFETQKRSNFLSLKIQFRVKSSFEFWVQIRKSLNQKSSKNSSLFELYYFDLIYAIAFFTQFLGAFAPKNGWKYTTSKSNCKSGRHFRLLCCPYECAISRQPFKSSFLLFCWNRRVTISA